MLDQKNFGEKLRKYRKKLGMTQEEAGEKIGVSAQAISKWEMGDCLPDCFNLKAISDVYKVSTDALLENEPDENYPSANKRNNQAEKSVNVSIGYSNGDSYLQSEFVKEKKKRKNMLNIKITANAFLMIILSIQKKLRPNSVYMNRFVGRHLLHSTSLGKAI